MSAERGSGDVINFIFSGRLSDNTMSGVVYMGEYLNAKFTGKRHAYQGGRGRIMVPGGPPLAN
jgi:D-glucosaminate-6-phosphate ammonia-lyase